jgi:hypothetical protein
MVAVNNKSNKVIVRNGRIVFELICCRFFSFGEPVMGTAIYTNPTGITPKYLLRLKVIVKF